MHNSFGVTDDERHHPSVYEHLPSLSQSRSSTDHQHLFSGLHTVLSIHADLRYSDDVIHTSKVRDGTDANAKDDEGGTFG